MRVAPDHSTQPLFATCQCGKVELQAVGRPIVSATCYCQSCQKAGSHFEQLSPAPPVLNRDGGTDYLLVRKDRVRCVSGHELLREYRLTQESPTRRVIATCCRSAMFLDFTKGHWLTLYRNRFSANAPPVELRVMTRERRDGVELPDDLPNYSAHSGKVMRRLLAAWIAMGFRKPKMDFG